MTNTKSYCAIDRLRLGDKQPIKPLTSKTSGQMFLALKQGCRKHCWIASILLGVLVSGCSTSPPILKEPEQNTGLNLVSIAEGQLGLPYTYGSAEPDGFDCSGLVQYVHRKIGVSVPRTARAQYSAAKSVSVDGLQPGDIVFFRVRKQHVDHVGIFAGNQRFIHAPSAGKRISYSLLTSPYWKSRLIGAGRFY